MPNPFFVALQTEDTKWRLPKVLVPDEFQVDLVRGLGCTYAQGFLLSRPVPAEELSALLAEGRRRTGGQRLPSWAAPA